MEIIKKILLVLLAFVFVWLNIADYYLVLANSNAKDVLNPFTENTDTVQMEKDEVAGLKDNIVVEETILPDIVKQDGENSSFIERVKAKETSLNTFVFKNQDGTQTMKVYSHPVKYIDEKGKVQDISTDIKANENGSFETKANSIKTAFSKKLKDGITLTHNNVNIRLVADKTSDAVISQDKKTVSYIYDNKTTIEYSLTYTGFKEDIVVNEYTGQTEYEFTLYTNGLTLVKEHGSYFLKDSSGNIKATLGDIIIFTADEKNNTFGDMTHETITPNQEYVITIHVDSEYLKDPKTKYPIRIDPTIEINYDNNGSGAIEDITINQNTTYGGTSGSLYVGRSTDGSLNRVLMRFPNLSLDGISASQIVSANVEMRDLLCQDNEDMIISCHTCLISAPSWSESATISWLGMGDAFYSSSALDSHEVSYGQGNATGSGSSHRYRFDITSLACEWANGTQSPAKGIVFKATDSFEAQTGDNIQYWKKTFASYNRASNKPSLSITYLTIPEEVSVVIGNTVSLTLGIANYTSITWSSEDETVATVDNQGVITGVRAGKTVIDITITANGNTIYFSCIVYVRIEDGVYNIENFDSEYFLNASTIVEDFPVGINDIDETDVYTEMRTMWKIKYLSHGMYSIRPMTMLSMGLAYDENLYGVLQEIGVIDTHAAVGEYARWSIAESENGFKICLNGNENMVLQLYMGYTSSGTYTIVDLEDDISCAIWTFMTVANPPEGIMLYNTTYEDVFINMLRYVSRNSTQTLSQLHIKPAVYSPSTIEQNITWSSNNQSVVAVDPQTGDVTTMDTPGIATITGTVTIGDNTYNVFFRVEVLSVDENIYYIRNQRYSKTLQIDNLAEPEYNMSGAAIEQWDVDKGRYQKWEIIPIGNGYYKILSLASGLALSVPAGYETSQNVTVRQEAYAGYERQKWKITQTEDGKYKIKSQASENGNLDLALASSNLVNNCSNGITVMQREYTEGSNYESNWELITPGAFDRTYYFVNYYDSTVANYSDLTDFITDVNETVIEFYEYYFNINIVMINDILPIYSLADQCPLGNSLPCSNSCNAGTAYSSKHHKDVLSMSDQIYNDKRNDNYIYILWSNRPETAYCNHATGTHSAHDSEACVVDYRPVVHILRLTGTRMYQDPLSFILAHEVAHTFGLNDRYEIPTHKTEGEAEHRCVMEIINNKTCGAFWSSVKRKKNGENGIDLFCSVCMNDLRELIDNKYHMNNID